MDFEKITPDDSTKRPVAQTIGKMAVKTGLLPAPEDKPSRKGWSIFFFIVAINFGIGGCNVAYADSKVVGGDACNYIISAGRGTAIVGLGILFALVSVVLAIYDLTNVIVNHNERRD